MDLLPTGYDGGDCCSCTCEDPTNGGVCDTTYDCRDLDASCYNSDAAPLESSSSSSPFSNETLYIAVGAGICGIIVIAILILWRFCTRNETPILLPLRQMSLRPSTRPQLGPPAVPRSILRWKYTRLVHRRPMTSRLSTMRWLQPVGKDLRPIADNNRTSVVC